MFFDSDGDICRSGIFRIGLSKWLDIDKFDRGGSWSRCLEVEVLNSVGAVFIDRTKIERLPDELDVALER